LRRIPHRFPHRFPHQVLLIGALALGAAAPPAAAPHFEQAQLPATGTQTTLLTIPAFGRYALSVASAQGSALQLIDRMTGPGPIEGTPGAQDGRLDAFLAPGTYKLRVISDAHGTGAATLTATPFTEPPGPAQQLVEFKPVIGTLADDQSRSWWIVIKDRGTYDFEAGGRYLGDLRLWRDGWMVPTSPIAAVNDTGDGQPLTQRDLAVTLEPGLYRLTAYGGPGAPWATGATDAPFMLRWGVPRLADAGRYLFHASPQGIDRYILPGDVTDIQLILDRPGPGQLSAQTYTPESMFDTSQSLSETLTKTDRDPLADLSLTPDQNNDPWLVNVSLPPGTPYHLAILNSAGNASVSLDHDGTALLATTLPGHPDDELDAGFLLADDQQHLIAASAIELDHALPWRRHVNLLGGLTTLLHTTHNLDLTITGTGAGAQYTLARFFSDSPDDNQIFAPRPGGIFTLTPGFYKLAITPLPGQRGSLTLSMTSPASGPPTADSPRLPAAFFPSLSLSHDRSYTLFTTLPDEAAYGFERIDLPANLSDPLAFELAPHASADIPLTLKAGQLTVTDETGAPVPFTLDDKPSAGIATVTAGDHDVTVTAGARLATITLTATPTARLPATALPTLTPAQIAPAPLPTLTPDAPLFTDLDKGETQLFNVTVPHDALYSFATTGLLETGGSVRTRLANLGDPVEGNGTGRNFVIDDYLHQGDYRLGVTAQGDTAGHTGITVTENPLVDAGTLNPGDTGRLTLMPGTAALYHLHISTPGAYHLYTLGLAHPFTMRLEDAEGWPLITPGGPADASMSFAAGDYRVILLPGAVPNRAVTTLVPITPPVTRSGHGPFAVSFGDEMDNRWLEPGPGAPRTPDRWTFSLPAPATATITITDGIGATLHGASDTQPIATTAGTWTGQLPAGAYVIDTASVTPNNRVDYSLTVSLAELTAGQSRDVTAPAKIPLSLAGGPEQIFSTGPADVRATLRDAAGHVVAANDDRDNDWNFLLAGLYPPGTYTLDVEPVGAATADTTVSVQSPAATDGPALAANGTATLTDGLVHIISLPTADPDSLIIAGAQSTAPVILALEGKGADGAWTSLGTASGLTPALAIPAGPTGTAYRLRVWPENFGHSPITVATATAAPDWRRPAGLAGGIDLTPVTIGSQTVGVARVHFDAPHLFKMTAGDAAWTATAGTPATVTPDATIAAASQLWLFAPDTTPVTAAEIDLTATDARITPPATGQLSLPAPETDAPTLWTATQEGAAPGLALTTAGAPLIMAPGGDGGAHFTATAFQPQGLNQPQLTLWQAANSSHEPAQPATLHRQVFADSQAVTLTAGSQTGSLPPGAALTATLPAGPHHLAMVLAPGAVAAFVKAGQTEHIIAGNGALPDELDTQADTLILMNPTAAAAAYNLTLTQAAPTLTMGPSHLLTRYSATPAILHLTFTNGDTAKLQLAGTASDVAALDASGRLTTGEAAAAGSGGTAAVTVGPGLAVIALAGPAPVPAAKNTETPPAALTLAGPDLRLAVPAGPARLIALNTETPVLLRDAATGAVTLFPAGGRQTDFQPAGQTLTLDLLSPTAAPLTGTARLETIAPTPITDGLGPATLLGPGQSRLYSFSVTAPRRVGVGVRGSVDDAQLRLFAADGTKLAAGVIAMQSLPPGTYYLAVDLPLTAAASLIQPALVGVTLPDDGPPPDVQAQYQSTADQPN
jgi:hypothetical protein